MVNSKEPIVAINSQVYKLLDIAWCGGLFPIYTSSMRTSLADRGFPRGGRRQPLCLGQKPII